MSDYKNTEGLPKTEPKSFCLPCSQLKQMLCVSKACSSKALNASKANLCHPSAPVYNCLLHICWWALVATAHSAFPPHLLQLPHEIAASLLISPLASQWVHQAFCQVCTFTYPSAFARAEATIGLEIWKAPVQKSLSS